MNDAWFAATIMFSLWMGTTLIYILYGYPIKMMVKDNENQQRMHFLTEKTKEVR